MSQVIFVWPTTLPDDMTGADVEKFWVEEFLPNISEMPGTKNSLYKGFRGERKDQYLFFTTFESIERWREIFSPEGDFGPEAQQWIADNPVAQKWIQLFFSAEVPAISTNYAEIK